MIKIVNLSKSDLFHFHYCHLKYFIGFGMGRIELSVKLKIQVQFIPLLPIEFREDFSQNIFRRNTPSASKLLIILRLFCCIATREASLTG